MSTSLPARRRLWQWNGSSFTASKWTTKQAKTVRFDKFLSPSHNLWCNVGDEDIFHCSSGNRPHSVSLSPTGVVTVCDPCAVNAKLFDTGSPVAGSPVLEYGSTNEIGRYRCISRAEGITCTVFLPGKGHGNGFLINAAGVQRIG